MALNIPNVGSNMETLFKGLNTGSDLIHKMMLNKYYSEPHASGDVANASYVESLRSKYGEQDPRYLEAKRAHDLTLKGRESLMDYRGTLGATAGVRATSPLGKLILEKQGKGAQDILDNRSHGGSGVMMPEHPEQEALMQKAEAGGKPNVRTPEEQEIYDRKINKETTDEQARKVLRRAENLDITRESINKYDLTRYSGPENILKWAGDNISALRGKPSKQFIAHKEAAKAASLMAKQMRQFYEDSIQPEATKQLVELSNPSSFLNPSKVAIAQWDQLNKILDQETATYKKYGTSPIQSRGIEYKDGKFILGKEGAAQPKEDLSNEGGSFDMSAVVPQLLKINPKYTEKAIRSTAKVRGITPDQVINELFQRSVKGG